MVSAIFVLTNHISMRQLIYFLLITVFKTSLVIAQCPTSEVYLKNQSEIDSFAITYPNCKSLHEAVLIQPDSPGTDDITNLDAFAGLDSMVELTVRNCDLLTEIRISDIVNIGLVGISNCPLVEKIQVINNLTNDGWLYLNNLPAFDSTMIYNIDTLFLLSLSRFQVSSLGFLGDIKNVEFSLSLLSNPLLNDISQLEGFNTAYFNIENNTNLSICSISAVCQALREDISSVEIYNNGVGCQDVFDVYYNCFPDSDTCVFKELTLRSQTDLEQLSLLPDHCIDSIRSITIRENSLGINPVLDLTNMQRFKQLDYLSINSNTDLNSLQGLDSLVSVEELILLDNPRIKSLEGFGGLKNVKQLTISSMDSLITASDTDMYLLQCDSLTIYNSPVEDFSSFSGVDSFSSVLLLNTRVTDMSWASDVRKINQVRMSYNDALLSFSFDVDGPLIGSLFLNDNVSLTEMNGLTFQDSVHRIELYNNPIAVMTNISGPSQVSSGIDIRNCNLSGLSPWDGVEEANAINLFGNKLLTGIEFLTGFSKLKYLTISGNEVLEHIGTSPIDITYIDHLSIRNNPLLSDVSVLDYDFNIDRIDIRDNPSLSTCDALSICKQYKSIYPNIYLDGNGEQCNLKELNFECDYGHNAYGSVVVKSQSDIDSIQHFFPQMDSVFGNLIIDFSLNSAGADYSFFDSIQFIRDRLEIRHPRKDGVFEMFKDVEVAGLLLVGLETSSLDIIDYKDELSIFRLTSVEGLDDFKGLENVKEINDVDIVECSVTLVDGLDSLVKARDFQIVNCENLTDIRSLSNLEQVRNFRLAVLPMLTGLDVFDDLRVLTTLQLIDLPLMTEVPSFDLGYQLSTFSLSRNSNITDVTFDSLQRVYEYFSISRNPNLENASFGSLQDGKDLWITENGKLEQILLPSLLQVQGTLGIGRNIAIEDISGINSEALASNLEIYDNDNLQDCNTELICNNADAGATIRIENNAGCQSIDDVLPHCMLTVDDERENGIRIYPNPSTGLFDVSGPIENKTLQLYNSFGQILEISRHESTLNISDYNPGIYFLKYKSKGVWYIHKLVKI
jgi:hypothetical protein